MAIPRWLSRTIYYPTLGYNLLLGRVLKVRRWWDPINEHLILGARPMLGDPDVFNEMGITGVVNTCEEMKGLIEDYRRLNIEQLWLPTTDFHHPKDDHVDQGADFIERHRLANGKVYVHCKAGRARSATVVLWWLVKYGGMTPQQAQQHILRARPHSNPRVYERPVIKRLYSKWKEQEQHTDASTPSSN